MGYNLTIGELEIEYVQDKDCPHISLNAASQTNADAPAFGEGTDYTNQRWPSYTAWSNFYKFVGLEELFTGKNSQGQYVRDDGLLVSHPGCVPLTKKHREEINKALDEFKIKYPDAIPTYGNPGDNFEGDPNNPEENAYLVRLVWLQYWVNWALDNCKQPVFENS